jgi:5-methylcytosine-specific restriction enzyme A
MTLAQVTRESILSAVAEFDAAGRDAFLDRYGFEPARAYVLVHDGREYDSKAIFGAAHGYATGEPLSASDFSGGAASVGRRLTALGFTVHARIDLDWTDDELILACDLVADNGWRELRPPDPRVQALSDLLRRLPIYPVEDRRANFRSPNSVSRKTSDIMTTLSDYDGRPTRGGEATKRIVERFRDDVTTLKAMADRIREGVESGDFADMPPTTTVAEELDPEAEEGGLLMRRHLRRERNPALRARKITRAKANGWDGSCEVCGFHYERTYGERGSGYIECHHTVPLHVSGPTTTKLADLILICANCHRMIHRGAPWLTPDELRTLVTTHSA